MPRPASALYTLPGQRSPGSTLLALSAGSVAACYLIRAPTERVAMRRSVLASRLRLLAVSLLSALAPAAQPLLAQTASAIAPETRVVAPVSNTMVTTLKGNVHPLAQARFDQGAVPASNATGRMLLLLRRSDAQQTALHRYMDDLQNPSSPNYRKWLTPETLGKSYGISDADLASVKGWLESQGLRVESVPQARNMVVFSGTVGAVQTAFHTSIHSFVVDGETHVANTVDPQIPTALVPVIAGISPMNNFRPKPQHHLGSAGVYNPESKRVQPKLVLSDSSGNQFLYVDPADAATIYNTPNSSLNAHYSASHSWDGTGITIGVVGYSNITAADVLNYRTAFLSDPNSAHLPQVIVDGTDPRVLSDGTGEEALLDTEISGGLAPGAASNYYTAQSTDLQDGLALAILRALDDNQVSILSASYGSCESALGAAGNLQYANFWEQAASQGITVTVSTGDGGSAACDDTNTQTQATQGLAVSGLASTPYDIAVGGTDFAVLAGSGFAQYVSTGTNQVPPYESANGFIPEVPWNDSVVTDGTVASDIAYKDASGNGNIVAGAGGKSSVAYCSVGNNSDGSCSGLLSGYPKPAFQTGVTPSDGVRDIPDVSFFAANGAYSAVWVYCSDNVADGVSSQTYTDCQSTGGQFTSTTTFGRIGGTSAAAPAFAGMLALVAQSQGGIRLGQANNVLYNLAANHYSTVFHDVTSGNNSVPCKAGTPNCASNGFLTGYDTGTGYDYASGLGSVDVSQLVSLWSSASFTATTTSLGVGTTSGSYGTAPVSVTHGTPLYFKVAVSPSSATGDVSVTNTSGVKNNQASYYDDATLSGGVAQYGSNDLPGGTYSISAYYAGDATHAPSTSPAPEITVNIGTEASGTVLAVNSADPQSSNAAQTASSFPYGYYAYADAEPYALSQVSGSTFTTDGVPTGMINLNFGSSSATVALNSIGLGEYPLFNQAPGSYSLTASYSGDASYSASASPTVSFSVTKGATQVSLASVATTGTGTGVNVLATVTTDSLGASPTGTATLSGGGQSYNSTQPATGSVNGTAATQYTFVVPTTAFGSGSSVSFTATYAGDTNYSGSTVTAPVSECLTSFCLIGPAGGLTIAAAGQSGSGNVTVTPASTFTGTVNLSCSVSGGTGIHCTVPSTATIATSGTSATALLTVTTTAATAENRMPLRRFFAAGGEVALGCLLLLGVPARRRSWQGMLALLCILGGVGMIGCSSSSSSSGSSGSTGGTAAGSYTVTVTGTSSGTSPVTATTTVSVTVQ